LGYRELIADSGGNSVRRLASSAGSCKDSKVRRPINSSAVKPVSLSKAALTESNVPSAVQMNMPYGAATSAASRGRASA
jgi:hypothetical protein